MTNQKTTLPAQVLVTVQELETKMFALRIALALERIADRLDTLTLETETAPVEATPCLHPEASRMALGLTDGWICQDCQHQVRPS